MDFFSSKEKKLFFKTLAEEYGYTGSTDHTLYKGGNNKIYLLSRGIELLPFENMKIKQGGLYIAQIMSDSLRLTMDGAIFFGPDCKKTHEINEKQKNDWMNGENIVYKGEEEGFIIIKYKEYILGCGRIKECIIINFVPKGRRISDPH